MKMLKSKVDYFGIKNGDYILVVDFIQAEKGALSYYKTVLPEQTKIHYLFEHEVVQVKNCIVTPQ